jgi:hypothetical protein
VRAALRKVLHCSKFLFHGRYQHTHGHGGEHGLHYGDERLVHFLRVRDEGVTENRLGVTTDWMGNYSALDRSN